MKSPKKKLPKQITKKLAQLQQTGQRMNRAGKAAFKSGLPYAKNQSNKGVGVFEND